MEKIWQLLDNPPASFFQQFPELPPAVAALLYHRGLVSQEKIDEFLQPDYSQDVHDPYLFRDMAKAAERIFQAIGKQEKIIVHGDYDADGVSAAVILTETLKILDAKNVGVFLPHRETDGYGLNKKTVQTLADSDTELIITCDCGISNREEIELANSLGIDVIVTDHHAIPDQLPPALAIIHPKVPGENYPEKGLAGGGVAFKLTQGLLKKHRENHPALPDGQTHEGFEKWLLDMVAIASVADMVPLLGETRTLCKFGLIVLNKTQRVGLQKLLLEARLLEADGNRKRKITTDTIGYQIAPRINAAGRMNHASVAYNLLMTRDETEATELAYELNQNNENRQKMTEELVKQARAETDKSSPILFHLGQNWSTGIIGLIAGRLKDRYYKPSIVMAENNGEITGSGRSVAGFNLTEALQEMADYFLKFGGHPMACGFTLKSADLIDNFKTELTRIFKEKTAGLDLQPSLSIDAEVDLDEIGWELYDLLEKFEPFGVGNDKPKYLARGLKIVNFEGVGQDGKHLRLMVSHRSSKIHKAIGWNLCNDNGHDRNWCQTLAPGNMIDLVFEIDINEWNGNRELQLTIVDLKKI